MRIPQNPVQQKPRRRNFSINLIWPKPIMIINNMSMRLTGTMVDGRMVMVTEDNLYVTHLIFGDLYVLKMVD